MAKERLEYFHQDVTIKGIHSRYLGELWEQNEIQKSYVKTLYQMYAFAAVIGLRTDNPKPADPSEEKKTIQAAQLWKRRNQLNVIMQMVLLLDDRDGLTNEQKIDRAFRGPETEEEFKHNVELFDSYVRGGIEYLYDKLVVRELSIEDEFTDKKIGNIIAFLEDPLIVEI